MDDPSLSIVGSGSLTPDAARCLPESLVVRLMVDRPSIRPVDVGDVVEIVAGAGGRLGAPLVVLAWLERLRRPFFPPLFMGGEEHLLSQLTVAYDIEAEAIGRETARVAGLAIEFEVGEPLTWPSTGAPFDAIYFSPGIYSHIPGRDRRVRTLARLRDLLAPDGLIVVGPVLAPPLPLLSRTRLVDALRRIGRRAGLRRLAEPGDHFYRGHALRRAPTAYRYIHRFRTRGEAEAELADAGLVVTESLDETCWIARTRRR